jgi:hypothetical protein
LRPLKFLSRKNHPTAWIWPETRLIHVQLGFIQAGGGLTHPKVELIQENDELTH